MSFETDAAGAGRPAPALSLLLEGLFAPPFRGPVLVAGAGLGASWALDLHADLPLLCGGTIDHLQFDAVVAGLKFLIATNPPGTLALAWFAMLVAMMTPLIAVPLSHVRTSSLLERRWRASAGFLLGYFGVWGATGIPLAAAVFSIRLVVDSMPAAFLMASLLALIWSASPFQKAAQNRAHRVRRIGLFGFAADRDCIASGAALGGWCVASCWAWMLVSLLVPGGHVPAMIAVSAILIGERLGGPGPARWRMPAVLSRPLAWGRGYLTRRQPGGARGHV